jgi:HAE1 family hydrophobic/amphiphilic exporter-1
MSLSEPFIRRPVMTTVLSCSSILLGAICYFLMPVNDLPNIPSPVIQVSASYPGADPTTMANNIASPLEKQFLSIQGIQEITSTSSQGFTSITVAFQIWKSIDSAATDVQQSITQATGNLPTDLPSPPTFKKTNPNDQPIIYIAVTSATLTLGQLYEVANTDIGQRISILKGVSNVTVYGSAPAFWVDADPSKLASRGMSLTDFAEAVGNGTQYTGVGQFDGKSTTFALAPQGQLSTIDDYSNLIVKYEDGRPVYVRDVAKVRESIASERLKMDFWYRHGAFDQEAVVLAVSKADGANAVAVSQAVKAIIPELQKVLPGSVQMIPIYDKSVSIIASVEEVMETLFIAFILVVLVIFLFLGRATDTLIPAVALPLSLALTFIIMWMLGYSIDNLSLLALVLAIGFLVDDAIVFLENTVRRMETYGEDSLTATLRGASEISFTILSMTLSLAAVFIPLVFMPGQIGRIFEEFGMTIIIATLASGVVSLTLTPLMCSRVLGKRGHDTPKTRTQKLFDPFFLWITRLYGRSLTFFLRNAWISVAVFFLSAALTWVIYTRLPQNFLPPGDSGFIFGVFLAPESSSPEQMVSYQKQADAIMKKNDLVDLTVTVTNVQGFLPSNMGLCLAWLRNGKRPSIQDVSQQLAGELSQIPGIFPIMNPYPVLKLTTGATPNTQGDYGYAVSGLNPDDVYRSAFALFMKAQGIQGITPPSTDMHLDSPQLKINIDRERAMSYDVTTDEIMDTLRNAFSQNYVYLIKTPNDQYQVIIETASEYRANPDNLNLLYVRSTSDNLVPFNAVCSWEQVTGPLTVNHLNQFTSATIFFNMLPGSALGDALGSMKKFSDETLLPGVTGKIVGQGDMFTQLFSAMPTLLFFAFFTMYVILALLYENYLHPLTVLSTLIPAGLGGMLTLWIFGKDFSLYTLIGFFMLIGIVKKNGILVVDFALQQMDAGKSPREAVHEACMERFRPIIMTTLAALMGAVPMAIGWGAGGGTRIGLGFTIIGGLVVSQVITLYVTPVLFLFFEWVQETFLDKTTFFRNSREKMKPAQNAPVSGAPALASEPQN